MAEDAVEPDDESDVMSDADALEALRQPAIYVNTVAPLVNRGVIRLAFGETLGGETIFHSSVAMNVGLAKQVIAGLKVIVKDIEEEASAGVDGDH